MRIIGDEEVFGKVLDDHTRCAHYHGERDIIALKFKCCDRWFPCYECHAETSDHESQVWRKDEFGTKAVLCGACGHQLSISEYFDCNSVCPNCQNHFNPNCARHYHLYFETLPY